MSTPSTRTWWALTADESRRLLLHPAFAGALLLVVVPWAVTAARGRSPFPSLTNASWEVQLPYLIVAAGLFLAASLTGSRTHRHQTLATVLAYPMPRPAQVGAQLVAVVPAALLAGLCASADVGVQASSPGAVGGILPFELATVPAVALLAGCLGVAAGQLTRGLGASLGVLAVLGIATMAAGFSVAPWRWLGLVALESPFEVPPVPALLAQRPAGWHVLWLVALTGVVVCGVLAVRGGSRRVTVTAAVSFALVAAAAAVPQLTAAPILESSSWKAAVADPAVAQRCVSDDTDTYCVFPGFEARIDAWAQVVREQRAVVPADGRSITVRQRLPGPTVDGVAYAIPATWAAQDATSGTPDAIPVSTRWAGTGEDSFAQTTVLAFALGVANDLVTDAAPPVPEGGRGSVELCGGPGVVTLWLAAGATEAGRSALSVIDAHGDLVGLAIADSGVDFAPGPQETAVVRGLLEQPTATVSQRMTEHWAALTAPSTTVDEAADLLGVTAPPKSDDTWVCRAG